MVIDNVNYTTGIIKYILSVLPIDYIVAINQQKIILRETKIFEEFIKNKGHRVLYTLQNKC